jgi:hypothetical protein
VETFRIMAKRGFFGLIAIKSPSESGTRNED